MRRALALAHTQTHIHARTYVREGRHVAAVHPAGVVAPQAAPGRRVDKRGGRGGGPAPQHGRHHVQVQQLDCVCGGWVGWRGCWVGGLGGDGSREESCTR